MNYINPPSATPPNVSHRVFHSKLYGHDIGYNIYLPPDYEKGAGSYPVAYHFHGWTGDESSELWQMESVCEDRRAITVFPNSSPVIEDRENLPVESMVIDELIPHIDETYSTDASRGGRSASGFSMGGGFAFYRAVKYPELFASVTAYAGTYHHYLGGDYHGVGEPVSKAAGFYEYMLREEKFLEEDNVLCVVRQNADKIRGRLRIKIIIGTDDPLICENEIMHLYLEHLKIPHEYVKVEGAGHDLALIVKELTP